MNNNLLIKNAKIYEKGISKYKICNISINDGIISICSKNNPKVDKFIIDARHRLVCKPFCDYHIHLPGSWIYDLYGINLCNCCSVEEYFYKINNYSKTDTKIIRGYGWDSAKIHSFFKASKLTPIELLDTISSSKPTVLFSMDFHSCWCNSKAVNYMLDNNIVSKHDIHRFDGIINYNVSNNIFNSDFFAFEDYEIEEAILNFQNTLMNKGISEIYSYMFIGASKSQVMKILNKLDNSKMLHININCCLDAWPNQQNNLQCQYTLYKQFNNEHIKVNVIKLYIDGTIENGTAFLINGYYNIHYPLISSLWQTDNLNNIIIAAIKLGLYVHIHTIGDAAINFVLDSIEQININIYGKIILAHAQLCKEYDIARIKKYGIYVCVQPFWFYRGINANNYEKYVLGSRVYSMYRMKSFINAGIKVLSSSDAPVTPDPNPFIAMKNAINNDGSGEQVDLIQAYKTYYEGILNGCSEEIQNGDTGNLIIVSNDFFQNGISNTTKIDSLILKGHVHTFK